MKFNWRAFAQCRGVDPNIFVPAEGVRGMGPSVYSKARKYCNACSVKKACLDFAISEEIVNGMFGGMTPRERRAYIKVRKSQSA